MKCEDCRFWKRCPTRQELKDAAGATATVVTLHEIPPFGTCHINPPTLQPYTMMAGTKWAKNNAETQWPVTNADSFCGKHEYKPSPGDFCVTR